MKKTIITIYIIVLCAVFGISGDTFFGENSSGITLTEPTYTPGMYEWYKLIDTKYYGITDSYSIKEEQIMYMALLKASKSGNSIKVPMPHIFSFVGEISLNADYPETELFEYETKYNGDFAEIIPSNMDEYNQKIDQIDSIISELVDSVEKEPSIINKYRLIHDWIVENVEYDFRYSNAITSEAELTDEEREYVRKGNADNIYGAIVEKKAVCSGISEAFKYICNKCGLDVIVVSGSVPSSTYGGHAWNVVPIYETYYIVDCTWDLEYKDGIKTGSKYKYFLVNDLYFEGREYFQEEIVKELNHKNSLVWDLKENHAESNCGITIDISDDYIFYPSREDNLLYALNSDALTKVIKGQMVDDEYFSTNGEIVHIIYIDYSSKVKSIIDYSPETKGCYKDKDSSEFMFIIINYGGKEYPVKIKETGL